MRRDVLDGTETVRVAAGYESQSGAPDPQHFNGYWFDDDGRLVRSYRLGIETRQMAFAAANGVDVARRVEVRIQDKLEMIIEVTGFGPTGTVDPGLFVLKGHEWVRQFTAEMR
jgi:hypothetical protein